MHPRHSRRSALRWAGPIAAAVLLAAVACAGADVAPAAPDDLETRSDRQDYEEADEDKSGWRWGGSRQDCFFVYDNECFAYRDEACAAAGCDERSCTHDDSAPAVVSCPDADSPPESASPDSDEN